MTNPDEFTLREVQAIADYLDIEVAELLVRSKYCDAFLTQRDGILDIAALDVALAA